MKRQALQGELANSHIVGLGFSDGNRPLEAITSKGATDQAFALGSIAGVLDWEPYAPSTITQAEPGG